MSPDEVILMTRNTVIIMLYLSMPAIIAATVVGFIIALFQTLIQVQEQTVTFTAKLAAVIVTIMILGEWMAHQLIIFLGQMLDRVSTL